MTTSPPPADPAVLAHEPVVGDIEAFLREILAGLAPEPSRSGPGRPRILPALALWAGLLVCVLRGFSRQLDLWRLLTLQQLWDFPRFGHTDQAIYKRLAAGGVEPLVALFTRVSAVLTERLAPYAALELVAWAPEVMVLDHTTLDQIARWLPVLREVPAGDVRLLPGQLGGLFDLRRQQWRTVQFIAAVHQNEKVTARSLVASLPAGSLVLFDLGFFGFQWLDDLTEQQYFWLSRLRAGTSYEVVHTFYQHGEIFDGLVWLGKHRADRAKHLVRLVCYPHQGQLRRYLTNVREPNRLSLAQIAQLYARRWDFELAVKLLKRHLQLHLLWSAKDVLIQQQVWAVLTISQILQALRLEIAGRAGVDPFDVSMELLVRWVPRIAQGGDDPLTLIVARGRATGFIRPASRLKVATPLIPKEQITPLPPDLPLQRTPRYAHRKCGPRSTPGSASTAN